MRRKPASALGQGARMAASLPIESGGWWKCAWGRYNASRARNDLCGGSSEMQGVATYSAALIEPNLAVCRARLDKLLRFCQAFDPSSSVVRRGVPRRLTAQVELDDVFGGRQLQGQPACRRHGACCLSRQPRWPGIAAAASHSVRAVGREAYR